MHSYVTDSYTRNVNAEDSALHCACFLPSGFALFLQNNPMCQLNQVDAIQATATLLRLSTSPRSVFRDFRGVGPGKHFSTAAGHIRACSRARRAQARAADETRSPWGLHNIGAPLRRALSTRSDQCAATAPINEYFRPHTDQPLGSGEKSTTLKSVERRG